MVVHAMRKFLQILQVQKFKSLITLMLLTFYEIKARRGKTKKFKTWHNFEAKEIT